MNFLLRFSVSAIFFAFFGTLVQAQANIDICSNTEMQSTCPATCAQFSCGNEDFLSSNVSFCVANFFDEQGRANAKDNATCASLLGGKAEGDTQPAEVVVSEPVTESGVDCSKLGDIFEQEECELAKLAPACSSTVVELEGRSALLITDIKSELSTYGELLTRDYGDVSEREALCGFTREDLSASFKLASENPANLRSLQRQAQDVQQCQTDWENVVRGYKTEGTADDLVDKLVRGSEQKLEGLKVEISSLTTSVKTLENAAGTIRGIVRLYVAFCES